MTLRSIAVFSVALSVAAVAQARPQTTTPTSLVSVNVRITDSRITLNRHSIPRGSEGRFVIENASDEPHNFTLETVGGASASPAFTKTLGPHRRAVVRLFLDYRGMARYLDRLPADRNKPGMRGFFLVQ